MYLLKLIFRNSLRHKLRTALTTLGIVVAVLAFGLLQTLVDAWYAGAEAASGTRLVTRNAISLVFPLPITYADRIRQVRGVTSVSWANWFGGVYVSERNFFPQFAVEPRSYFGLYPEYLVPADQMKAFLFDRKGCAVGRKLADTYGWKLGDVVPLRGTIFPGTWEFVVRAIYTGKAANTDTSQFFFHWDYLNETLKRTAPRRANSTGIFLVGIADADASAQVAGMYSSLTPSMCAATCQECRNASASLAGTFTPHLRIERITDVGRLCQVTRMSRWLIGRSSSATPVQCGDRGRRWRTPAWAMRVLTAVTIISPRVAKVDVTLACTGTNSQLTGPAELVALNARHELPVTEVVPITNAGGASAMIVDYQIEAIPGLDENERLTTRSFEVGQLGLLELLLVRREILDTRFQYLDALLEAALARVDLDASAAILR